MRKKLVSLLAGALLAAGLITAGTPATAAPVAAHVTTPKLQARPLAGTHASGKGRPGGFHVLSCPCYDYAGMKQTVASDGFGISLMSVENPASVTSGEHSLTELSVSNGNNTVEWGWTRDPIVCGAGATPCLFASHWINGVWQGYNTGFTNAVGCSPCAGASISGAIGTTKQFGIQYVVNANPALNAWWMSYNGVFTGAYLANRWTSPTFIRGALNQAFSEVAANSATTCIDMGNGVLATGSPTFLGSKLNSYAAVNPTGAGTLAAFATTPTKWASFMATAISDRESGPGWC